MSSGVRQALSCTRFTTLTPSETHLHHLVVVDAVGVAVGMVSTLDVLRAMLGMEPYRPKAFDTF
jgi:CBS-domain-containing membrane protein